MPPSADPTRPSASRVYDYLVGGSENYPADREEARRLLEICPELSRMARQNRSFLTAATTWAASQGITQFIDLGAGMPISRRAGIEEIHQTAQAASPAARCVYVDHDPIAVSHSRVARAHDMYGGHGADLEPVDGVAVVAADLTEPAAVLKHPELAAVIDPAEPVCAILGLVLNAMPARRSREVVAGYADLIVPGSLLIVSCALFDAVTWKGLGAASATATPFPRNHARRTIAGFLAGLELVPPGISAAQGWRAGWQDATRPGGAACVVAAVARKP